MIELHLKGVLEISCYLPIASIVQNQYVTHAKPRMLRSQKLHATLTTTMDTRAVTTKKETVFKGTAGYYCRIFLIDFDLIQNITVYLLYNLKHKE